LTRIGKLEPEAADAQQFFDQVSRAGSPPKMGRWRRAASRGGRSRISGGKGLASAEEVKEMKSWGKTWNAASRLR
jgi:plasmid stabilization system protein ParE